MKPTSHFLGLSLSMTLLDDLFDELAVYITEHNLKHIVELSNSTSLHITLYYLDAFISVEECLQISSCLCTWNAGRKRNIHLRSSEYFYRGDSPSLLYIMPDNIAYFEQKNREARIAFGQGGISDNQLDFIPHITILRIHDGEKFAPHADWFENTVQQYIEDLWEDPVQDGFYLYSVDSRIRPELQVRVNAAKI